MTVNEAIAAAAAKTTELSFIKHLLDFVDRTLSQHCGLVQALVLQPKISHLLPMAAFSCSGHKDIASLLKFRYCDGVRGSS
jgi:hypothetical protein